MKGKSRGVQQTTLEKRVARWKKILKLGDWDIYIRYATKSEYEKEAKKEPKKTILGWVHSCDTSAKRALILINRDYHKDSDHKVAWNIDTLILHELIHIVIWFHADEIPESILKHSKMHKLEEFICDSFADIIYKIFYTKL